MKIKNVITEAKAQFGGEVIDFNDLPKSAKKKVDKIEKVIGLGQANSIEDDLKGKYVYVVFKNAAWGSKKEINFPVSMMAKIGKAASVGATVMRVIGQDVAFGIKQ